jgi:prevent-host-death family protein
MKTIGAYEAKTHLPALLDEVAAGEEITITKRGVPVAQLIPIRTTDGRSVAELIERMREISRSQTLGELSIRELIDEGRR